MDRNPDTAVRPGWPRVDWDALAPEPPAETPARETAAEAARIAEAAVRLAREQARQARLGYGGRR